MRETIPFNRMPRIQKSLPQDEIKIPAPPNVSQPPERGWLQMLLPLAGIFIMIGVYGGARGDWGLALPMVAMSGLSTITSIIGTLNQRKKYQENLAAQEAAYAEALAQKRAELEKLKREQQRIRIQVDPDLHTLLTRTRDRHPRLWERRSRDADFLKVRLGVGELPSTVAVSAPHPDMPDPRLQPAQAIEQEYTIVPQVPVLANLQDGPLGIAGPLQERTGVARALICNLVVHHPHDQVHLLGLYSHAQSREWLWLKWLPHTSATHAENGSACLANDSLSAQYVLENLLEELHRRQNQLDAAQPSRVAPDWPWLVVLVEDYETVRDAPAIHLLLSPEGRKLNVTALFMVEQAGQIPMSCHSIVECQAGQVLAYSVAGPDGETYRCRAEYADAELSEQIARHLSALDVYTIQSDTHMPTHVRLLETMEIKDIDAYDLSSNWDSHLQDQSLQVIIGARRGNQPLVLDLKHTAHGPHGLIAGTTGSGKSELVQTLVVALALTHHPYDVGFVLVDFKGGGTFSELVNLPHTLGMVTDLSGNLTGRALVALDAEIDRRKRLFNEAGVNAIEPYQEKYWRGEVREPLPRLVIIIDEFAELVSDYPEFMDGLIAIARVGRSLGVHLILATQSPAGVVKQQIWANAKFRICLRVESRQESQEMLHRPEAANLPRIPGRGYLQVGNNDVFELFQVARVAGTYQALTGRQRKAGDTGPLQTQEHIFVRSVSPLGQRETLFDSKAQAKKQNIAPVVQRTDIDVVVEKLKRLAIELDIKKLPSPWPEPLPDHVSLPDMLRWIGYAGWDETNWVFEAAEAVSDIPAAPPAPRVPTLPRRPWLQALLGLQDDPARQTRRPLQLKLDQQGGQLIVVGAPGSGKDVWVRTLITSLARTHAPDEVHFYLLEFGGSALQVFEGLPHVGSILTPLDTECVPRLFRLLLDRLDERKNLCGQVGVDGLVRLRHQQPDHAPPAVVVIITGLAEFRTMFQEEMEQLTRLIREGGAYGIHVILVGDRAGDIPMSISSIVARRVALRLADADEYSMLLGARIRTGQGNLPTGRGWYGRPPLEFQTASPGHARDENDQIAELQQLAGQMEKAIDVDRAFWQDRLPEPVLELPPVIPLAQLLSRYTVQSLRPLSVPIGLDYLRTHPVLLDLERDGPDFIISSTARGGKTTLLFSWVLALAEFYSPQQVQFILIAGRRNSLWPLQGLPHVLNYCPAPGDFVQHQVLDRLQAEMARREALLSKSPGQAEALPSLVLMIDDYDEFHNAVPQQHQPQLEKLAKEGRNVKLHTLITGPLPDLGGIAFRDSLVKQLKIGRSGFVLRILDPTDQNPLGLRLRFTASQQMPPGRGFIVRNGAEELLQVATPGGETQVADRVKALGQHWEDASAPARWPQTTQDE